MLCIHKYVFLVWLRAAAHVELSMLGPQEPVAAFKHHLDHRPDKK